MRTSRWGWGWGWGWGWSLGVIALAWGGAAVAGPSWVEPPCGGGDAGSTGGSAQSTTGSGTLGSISGNLCGPATVAAGEGDFEDVYRIRICDPKAFSARTAAGFNAQLWLFTDDGYGLLGNDDQSLTNTEAKIFAPADDGTNQGIPGAGVYLLAISGLNNDPRAMGNAIFNQSTSVERSGPDGLGGGDVLDGWASEGAWGEYVILLEGAALLGDDCFGPRVAGAPVPAVSEWGILILVLTFLSGGTILMGRR